jgi:glycosyltransferase involved in cell wall biosynthesis
MKNIKSNSNFDKNQKIIGLTGFDFINWTGGLDYLINIIESFRESGVKNIFLYIPNYHFAWTYKSSVRKEYRARIERADYLRSKFGRCSEIRIISTPPIRFFKVIHAYFSGICLLGPLMKPPIFKRLLPWFSWVWDYQHKYLPHFFSTKDVSRRNKIIHQLVYDSYGVICGSQSVKNDIKKFDNGDSKKIFVMPPFAINNYQIDKSIDFLREKYGIEGKYLICSNQFWEHKNHTILFKAFSRIVQKYKGLQLTLVCTGETNDYRNPEYFSKLLGLIHTLDCNKNIKILGLIPKNEQLALIKYSEALIQPTLFEGGAGGGSGYDALCLGKLIVMSDIPVNLEIKNLSNTIYFRSNDVSSLEDALESFLFLENKNLDDKDDVTNKVQEYFKLRAKKSILDLIKYTSK